MEFKKASDIFRGRIMGGDIDYTEHFSMGEKRTDMFENQLGNTTLNLDGTPEVLKMGNSMNIKNSLGVDKGSLLMGNTKTKTPNVNMMLGGASKGKSNINVSQFMGMNSKSKKTKNIDVGSFMGMNSKSTKTKNIDVSSFMGMNNQPMKNNAFNVNKMMGLGGKSTKSKSINVSKYLGSNMMGSKMPPSPEKRMKQQKGLSMFGDYDGDKLPNIFDCNPKNKNQQGFIHRLKNSLEGRGFVEDSEVARQDREVSKLIEYPETFDTPVGDLKYYGNRQTGITPIEGVERSDVIYTPVGQLQGYGRESDKYDESDDEELYPIQYPINQSVNTGQYSIMNSEQKIYDSNTGEIIDAVITPEQQIEDKVGMFQKGYTKEALQMAGEEAKQGGAEFGNKLKKFGSSVLSYLTPEELNNEGMSEEKQRENENKKEANDKFKRFLGMKSDDEIAFDNKIKAQAREQALKEITSIKSKEIYTKEKERILGIKPQRAPVDVVRGVPRQAMRTAGDATSMAARDFSAGVSAGSPHNMAYKINALMGIGGSGGGFGPGFTTMAGQQYQKPWPQTVFESVGGNKPEIIERPSPIMPPSTSQSFQASVSQPQAYVSPSPQIQRQGNYEQSSSGPAPGPGMVWSNKSKRWVRYTRQPYSKMQEPRYQQY